MITSIERLKRLLEHIKFSSTQFLRTILAPEKGENAVGIPPIRIEYAIPCNCSHLLHTCFQHKIEFGRSGEIRDN